MTYLNIHRQGRIPERIAHVSHANSFSTRLRGLLGKRGLSEEGGLLITPCKQVHTLGMRFTIDVLFLDEDGIILKCTERLKPGRIASASGAKHTLELAENAIQRNQLRLGERLEWRPHKYSQ